MPALAERPRSPISPAEAHASFIPVEDIRPITNVELPAEMAALVFGGIQPTEAVKHRLWETGSEAEAIRDLAGATAGVAVRGIEEIANMSQEVGETLIQHPTRTAATALTLSALLLAACAPQAQGNQDSQRYLPYIEKGDGSSAQTPATPQPTDTPRVVISPTFEAQPTATPPPETQKEQQTTIVPREYLSKARRKSINGNTYLVLALPSEVPVLAPKDGRVLDIVVESGVPFSGYKAILRLPDPPGGAYFIIGGLRFDTMPTVEMPQQKANPKKGNVIGYSTGGDIFITKTKRTPSGTVVDEDILREISPEAFGQPFVSSYNGPIEPTVSLSFYPTPPASNPIK